MSQRVFVIGAGASKGCDDRMPVMQGFFKQEVLQGRRPYGAVDYKALLLFLQKEFYCTSGPHLDELFSELNVEEVFLHLESVLEGTATDSPLHGEVIEARNQLIDYIARTLRYQPFPSSYGEASGPVVGESPETDLSLYEGLAEFLGPDDSVISFNWDTLLDQVFEKTPELTPFLEKQAELLHPSSMVADPVARLGPGGYLKLHGSLNWFVCQATDCSDRGIIRRHLLLAEPEDSMLTIAGRPGCIRCGAQLTREIIPPVAGKRSRMSPGILKQWRIAPDMLRHSKEWIFIGYSLPDLDVEAKSLFRSGCRGPYETLRSQLSIMDCVVHIADPQASTVEERIRHLHTGQGLLVRKYKDFADFIQRFERN